MTAVIERLLHPTDQRQEEGHRRCRRACEGELDQRLRRVWKRALHRHVRRRGKAPRRRHRQHVDRVPEQRPPGRLVVRSPQGLAPQHEGVKEAQRDQQASVGSEAPIQQLPRGVVEVVGPSEAVLGAAGDNLAEARDAPIDEQAEELLDREGDDQHRHFVLGLLRALLPDVLCLGGACAPERHAGEAHASADVQARPRPDRVPRRSPDDG
mmetsp:Transcript_97981/g.299496  ORF Transcript_97981/g.299496 Transcript_97981/m.299496 type:complete len:210 (+) Transcript_97981:917-1546(+)